jgi:arsenite-transporting ATPase
MRIILYSGKGGVGKTTMAAATGYRCSAANLRTLILSLDVAHSLADLFDLPVSLHDRGGGLPIKIKKNLWIQEIDVQEEVERFWGDIYKYIAALFKTTGLDAVVAEELAILPGMEEVVGLLYINQYCKQKAYDVIILDCAPTGESLRFISMPTTLEWYIKKIFPWERSFARIARPVAKMMTDIPLPDDSYFKALHSLFKRIEGVELILLDKKVTSVRLVTNPEKVVLKETQRAFMYFCLYGLNTDCVVVNRVFPETIQDPYFRKWISSQSRYLEEIQAYFSPVPIFPLRLFDEEIVGLKKLDAIGEALFNRFDPSRVLFSEEPYSFAKENGKYTLKLKLPSMDSKHVDLFKDGDELIIRIGSFKRHVPLPRSLAKATPGGARFVNGYLNVSFGG